MAFTQQDIAALKQAKAQGKTKEQALAALAQSRGQASSTAPTNTPVDPNSARADLSTGFQNAQSAVSQGVDRQMAVAQRPSLLGRVGGSLANGLRTSGEALSSIGSGALRALPGGTTVANVAEKAIGGGISAVAGTKLGKGVMNTAQSAFSALPEGAQTAVSDIGGAVLGGASIAGTLVAPGVASTVTKTGFKTVDSALSAIPKPTFSIKAPRVGEIINKYRAQLSDIDPRYETVLKQQQDPNKVMAYFDQAEKAAIDSSVPMATKIASDRAVEAFTAIGNATSATGKLKSDLLTSIEKVKITGNIPGNAIDNLRTSVGERFGVQIDTKGNITAATGRRITVDDKSQKLISEYTAALRTLGQSPTARELDDFVDEMQRKLYKQSSPNVLEVADAPVTAYLKQLTGEINSQLKTTVDATLKANGKTPEYAKLNEQYASLINTSNGLNKRLGIEGDKGASLMKSLFSPQTGEPTRRLFQEIKDATGVDLFEEATLAKFAMESVGDTRSMSLLQEIDALAGDVSKINFMEPGSWLNAIREKADLDGRDLANQIIKQSTGSFKQSATTQTNLLEEAKNVYHGSNQAIKDINFESVKGDKNPAAGLGFFTTPSKSSASEFGNTQSFTVKKGAKVMKVEGEFKNTDESARALSLKVFDEITGGEGTYANLPVEQRKEIMQSVFGKWADLNEGTPFENTLGRQKALRKWLIENDYDIIEMPTVFKGGVEDSIIILHQGALQR